MKQSEKLTQLLELMQANPELPVIPCVDGDVVGGDEYYCWLGSWGESAVQEFIIGKERTYYREDDISEMNDVLYERYDPELVDNMTDEETRAAYNALPWKKAIFVDVHQYEEEPDAMIQRLFEWKISAKPVHLILTGTRVNFYAAIQSLQPYRKGGDPGSIYYKIKLKEYREVRIRQVKVSSTGTATVSGGSTRTDNRVQAKTYTVKPGDCLYNISKSTLGDGGRYNEIYSLNKDKLKNPNLIYPGQVLQLP